MYRNSQRKVSGVALFKMLFAISLPVLSLVAPMTAIAQPAPTITQSDPVTQLVHISALSISWKKSYRPYSELIKPRAEQLWRDSDYAATVVALTKSGKVYAWGNNIHSNMGNGVTCTLSNPGQYDKKPPCYYDQPQDITKYFGGDRVIQLTGKSGIVVALTDSGKLYYWGRTWNNALDKFVSFSQPVLLDTLSPYRVTGFGGGYADDYALGQLYDDAWYAHNDDTIFYIGSDTPFAFSDDAKHIIKPKLDGATIKQVDYICSGSAPEKNGIYILTSRNKLLHIKSDGTTVETTNDKIKSRGGIKQILGNYAVDHQGGLWFYGYDKNIDSPVQDMSQKVSPTLPAVRDVINGIHDRGYRVIIRSTDDRIYGTSPKNGSNMLLRISDSTTLVSRQKIQLIRGVLNPYSKGVSATSKGYYDYSFIPADKLDTVCTGVSGVASIAMRGAEDEDPQAETTQPVNGTLPTTCVKMPPVTVPVPAPAPTPTQPSPSAPDFTTKRNNLRAPNTAG